MNIRIAIDHSSAQLQWVVWYGCFSFVLNLWLHARLFEGSYVCRSLPGSVESLVFFLFFCESNTC